MTDNVKRFAAAVLSLILTVTLLPLTAFAEDFETAEDHEAENLTESKVDYWDGTVADELENLGYDEELDYENYIIRTGAQLAYLAKLLNEGYVDWSGCYFKLANDIVLNTPDMFAWDEDGTISGAADGKSPNIWTPIGTKENPFQGTFDGCGHIISGIYVCTSGPYYDIYAGLFGYCDSANILNLGMVDGYINGGRGRSSYNHDSYCGAVAGYLNADYNVIMNCFNTCTVVGAEVGGIAGYGGDSSIAFCHNAGKILGYRDTGGILSSGGKYVVYCYNKGTVMISPSDNGDAGGISAHDNQYSAYYNCYNVGKCDSNGGGIVNYRRSTEIRYCYYLDESAKTGYYTNEGYTSNVSDHFVTALSDEQMRNAESFEGFDFEEIWYMSEDPDYPYPKLRSMYELFEKPVWNGKSADGFNSGEGTKSDPYIIKNAAQLAYFADSVNSGHTFEGEYIKLADDITLNSIPMIYSGETYKWTPIGKYTTESGSKPFYGNFDGDGHIISGIVIDTDEYYQGLFGCCINASIKNVGIIDGYIKGGLYTGGIAAAIVGSSVKNCFNKCVVMGTSCVGGIVGNISSRNSESVIENCYSIATIISREIDDYSGKSCVGGIVGDVMVNNKSSAILNCYSSGDFIGLDNTVGGLVGYCNVSNGILNISSCYSILNDECSLIGDSNVDFFYDSSDEDLINNNSAVNFENCYSIIKENYFIGQYYNYYYFDTKNKDFSAVASVCLNSKLYYDFTINTELPTIEVKYCDKADYDGFDFDNVWTTEGDTDYGYPELNSILKIFNKEPISLTFTPGDINDDGEIDNKDIVTLFRYHSGSDIFVNEIALDTNGDGYADNKDIVLLFRYVSGSDVELSNIPYVKKS